MIKTNQSLCIWLIDIYTNIVDMYDNWNFKAKIKNEIKYYGFILHEVFFFLITCHEQWHRYEGGLGGLTSKPPLR